MIKYSVSIQKHKQLFILKKRNCNILFIVKSTQGVVIL